MKGKRREKRGKTKGERREKEVGMKRERRCTGQVVMVLLI
jgi:hypothetical protein